MMNERSTSVWDALSDSPEEAENLRLRSKLMQVLTRTVQSWELPQKDAARRLHLTQPCVRDLLNGEIDKFSLDALVNILANADLEVDFTVRKKSA